MSYLDKLKKSSRNTASTIEKLNQELAKTATKANSNQADERIWKPELDKAKNGSAIIRFLPTPEIDGEDALPWVRVFDHGFQGPGGKWYIEKSLTSIGLKDPVSELNSKLWNSGIDANKEIARKQKRRLNYYANVLIVSDPKHPENEGQVRLFKFGKKIFEKITQAMNPEFDDEVAFNPFDPWTGADFKLKIRMQDGYITYDRSTFDTPAPISEDDKEIENILNKEYSLLDFLKPENFKPYAELQTKLASVLGDEAVDTTAEETNLTEETKASVREAVNKVVEKKKNKVKEIEADAAPAFDDADEGLDYFKSLAED